MSPQDTIEHPHLRAPEKLVRAWIDEKIASDGKWRKKKLTAKIKKMRCGCIGTELRKKIRILQPFSDSTN